MTDRERLLAFVKQVRMTDRERLLAFVKHGSCKGLPCGDCLEMRGVLQNNKLEVVFAGSCYSRTVKEVVKLLLGKDSDVKKDGQQT